MRAMLSPRHAEVLDALVLISNTYGAVMNEAKSECLQAGLNPDDVTFRDEILARANDDTTDFSFMVILKGAGRERRDIKMGWFVNVRETDAGFFAETSVDTSEFAPGRNWHAVDYPEIPMKASKTSLGSTPQEAALATISMIEELFVVNDLDVEVVSLHGRLAAKAASLVLMLAAKGMASQRLTDALASAEEFADATCASVGSPDAIAACSEIAFIGPFATQGDLARLSFVQSAMGGDFSSRFLSLTQELRPLSFTPATNHDTKLLFGLRFLLVAIGGDPRMGSLLHDRSTKVIDAFEFGIRCGAISTINDEMMDRVRDSMLTVGDVLGDAPMAS